MIALGLAVSFISFRGIVKDKFLTRIKKGAEKNDGLQKGAKKRLIKKSYHRRFCRRFFCFFGVKFSFSGTVFEYLPGVNGESPEKETIHHIKTPNEVRGIYMTSWVASTNNIRQGLVKLVEDTEINSIVIDIKDYTGKVAFLMKNPKVLEIGSSEDRVKDMKEFIKELHRKNIYIISRIAVFQDQYLPSKQRIW